MRGLTVGMALAAALCLAAPTGSQVPGSSPREVYDALTALRVDPAAVYSVKQMELQRADVKVALDEGTLAFLTPLQGHITGAVFSGRGHIFAAPREPVEKQQMARFLGATVLEQEFRSAYMRFTDATADELGQQLRSAKISPEANPDYAAHWNDLLPQLNPPPSVRILADWVSENPQPYFGAVLDGVNTGMFDFVVDMRREEQVLLGQTRAVEGARYYDVWASYRIGGAPAMSDAFTASHYTIETTVLPDHSLEGAATIAIRAERDGDRLLAFELSRLLSADSVAGPDGEPILFFQNEGLNQDERITRGSDFLYVILPKPPRKGEETTLRLRYRGSVISDAGNGVVFVGARGSWYPHLGGPDKFADYDLRLRWPRKLRLVATGTKVEEREEGEYRLGRWRTERPISVAGFNLGEYASASVNEKSYAVEVYANRQLEHALSSRLSNSTASHGGALGPEGPVTHFTRPREALEMPMLPPSPADALRQLAREISSSIRFYENYSGPFPYRQLSVSQIPGEFGQGWPGLLYVSTLSFLPAETQLRAGLTRAGQEHFSELVPFHEVAHQWWGSVVGWSSYRDQWIDEAFANYLALLFADSQKNPDRALRDWLARYRAQMLEKRPGEDLPTAEIGPLTLGSRLGASKSPNGFAEVIYPKGAWVIHMLRMLLRQPAAAGRTESHNPDARFIALMRMLANKYAYRALSTEELQREVEAVMTPNMDIEGTHSMEWFFDEWVRGVGIPRYRVEFSTKRVESGYLVRGKLIQHNVPRGFVAPVPLFANMGSGQRVPLGTVVTTGEETHFRFITPSAPRKILIDPQMTLLCVAE